MTLRPRRKGHQRAGPHSWAVSDFSSREMASKCLPRAGILTIGGQSKEAERGWSTQSLAEKGATSPPCFLLSSLPPDLAFLAKRKSLTCTHHLLWGPRPWVSVTGLTLLMRQAADLGSQHHLLTWSTSDFLVSVPPYTPTHITSFLIESVHAQCFLTGRNSHLLSFETEAFPA